MTCLDNSTWVNQYGHNCTWFDGYGTYTNGGSRCWNEGNVLGDGQTARDECCVCGGGSGTVSTANADDLCSGQLGMYHNNDACFFCPSGRYNDGPADPGSISCTDCPAGFTNRLTGMIEECDCKEECSEKAGTGQVVIAIVLCVVVTALLFAFIFKWDSITAFAGGISGGISGRGRTSRILKKKKFKRIHKRKHKISTIKPGVFLGESHSLEMGSLKSMRII